MVDNYNKDVDNFQVSADVAMQNSEAYASKVTSQPLYNDNISQIYKISKPLVTEANKTKP